MNEKQIYYVTVDKEDIRTMSVPDSGIEFEIEASTDEVEEIRDLFKKKKSHAVKAVEYLAKPFDEFSVDDERYGYDAHLMEIYRRIYLLGTDDTKQKMREMGIINETHGNN
ncbi:hypothetical protein DX933_04640 [Ornithinibacillus gellani]|uniref:hypothetical protein n=1 Tax=Ornithinibacillus gellani TaxID=2293253 RepID=UPI000F4879E7|nr:hypothetical protein [Ornithinibacillus gellani]TQS75569.1 hypothetical protein DX933_04640 [Ornithinibacillus gellani]